MKSNLKCEVVKDLLPSFVEKLTCEVTNQEITEHLDECTDCSASFEAMKSPDKIVQVKNKSDVQYMIKIKRKHLITTIVSIIFTILVFVALLQAKYYLFEKTFPVPSSDITISDVYLLSNGKMICKISLADGVTYARAGHGSSYSSGDGDFNASTFRYYYLSDRYFGINTVKAIPDDMVNYQIFDTSSCFVITDGKIETTGKVEINYQGRNIADTLSIWKTGDPLSIAPKELEEYAKSNNLLGYNNF